jgi:hypothetical protein
LKAVFLHAARRHAARREDFSKNHRRPQGRNFSGGSPIFSGLARAPHAEPVFQDLALRGWRAGDPVPLTRLTASVRKRLASPASTSAPYLPVKQTLPRLHVLHHNAKVQLSDICNIGNLV